MNKYTRAAVTFLPALVAFGYPFFAAHAGIDDDKPWDWEREELVGGTAGNSSSESLQHELREKHQHETLKLTIDHASWDAYLNQQIKQPVLSKRLQHTPGSVCFMAFHLIREYNSGGAWPGYGRNPPDTEDLDAEFRTKVNEFVCKYDLKAPKERFEYDPKTKVLTYIGGLQTASSATYYESDLIALSKKYFPKLKAWYIRHGKIES